MNTDPLYMLQPYERTMEATVLDYKKEDATTCSVVLDRTVFYPMGGGQATDQGMLMTVNGDRFEVFQVMIKEGEIRHYVKTDKEIAVGETVTGELNWERRYKNMKLHSAGHIIDFALYLLGYSPKTLNPQKAEHNKNPHIVYQGVPPKDIIAELQAKVDELVAQKLTFTWSFEPLEKLKEEAIYLQPNLPTNKPLRTLRLEGVGAVADGGTIVQNTSEVEGIQVTELLTEGDTSTVFYTLNTSKNVPKAKKITQERSEASVGDLSKYNLKPDELHATVDAELKNARTSDELTLVWRKFLGKEGVLTKALKDIARVDPQDRKAFGQTLNVLKAELDTKINDAKAQLTSQSTQSYLEEAQGELGFAKPKIGHLHPLTQTINDLNDIFRKLGYSVMDGPEIDTDEYNFVRTNLPSDHPARDLQDSIYVEEPNILLRTQTSSIEAHVLEDYDPPFKVVMPGRVYRNEKVNKSNHFTFHQYQLVCVQERVSLADLIATIDHLAKTFIGPDTVMRYRNKYYPEVEPGVGPDMRCFNCEGAGCAVCKHRGWIEMGGAGIRHPNMLRMAGIDPEKWQGYAFGLGLDRWAMAKYKISDIRTLLGGNLAYQPNVGEVE